MSQSCSKQETYKVQGDQHISPVASDQKKIYSEPGVPADPQEIQDRLPPTAPTGLYVKSSNSPYFTLVWKAAQDNITPASQLKYTIYSIGLENESDSPDMQDYTKMTELVGVTEVELDFSSFNTKSVKIYVQVEDALGQSSYSEILFFIAHLNNEEIPDSNDQSQHYLPKVNYTARPIKTKPHLKPVETKSTVLKKKSFKKTKSNKLFIPKINPLKIAKLSKPITFKTGLVKIKPIGIWTDFEAIAKDRKWNDLTLYESTEVVANGNSIEISFWGKEQDLQFMDLEYIQGVKEVFTQVLSFTVRALNPAVKQYNVVILNEYKKDTVCETLTQSNVVLAFYKRWEKQLKKHKGKPSFLLYLSASHELTHVENYYFRFDQQSLFRELAADFGEIIYLRFLCEDEDMDQYQESIMGKNTVVEHRKLSHYIARQIIDTNGKQAFLNFAKTYIQVAKRGKKGFNEALQSVGIQQTYNVYKNDFDRIVQSQ